VEITVGAPAQYAHIDEHGTPQAGHEEDYYTTKCSGWGGPSHGTVQMPGEQWEPYQPANVVTPPFPEFISGHSAFSAAGAEILRRFTGSDRFGGTYSQPKGSSRVEPGPVPVRDITLRWATFSMAADEAAMSRRYGGIHFEQGDLQSRVMGRAVGAQVWERAERYRQGSF
jgi:hypothetical protein